MNLNDTFFVKLNQICSNLGINPEDLLLVMYLESGVDPSRKNNAGSGATGLIQFMQQTLKGMGLSDDEVKNFHNTSAEQQLDYVQKYIRGVMSNLGGRPFKSAAQYYHANLFPRTLSRWIGSDPNQNKNVVVVGSPGKTPETDPRKQQQEAAAYKANGKYFDTNNKGYISVGDLINKLNMLKQQSSFQSLLKRLKAAQNYKETISKVNALQSADKPVLIDPTKKDNSKEENEHTPGFWNWLSSNLDKFISLVGLKSKMAQKNNFLICVGSNSDYTSSFEYARILCSALDEELKYKTNIFSDGSSIEIHCVANGDKINAFEIIKNISDGVADAFASATIKIGSIKPHFIVIADSNSDLKKVSLNKSLIEYRKFQYKIAARKTK